MIPVRLFSEEWEVNIDPQNGGIIKACSYKDRDVFRAYQSPTDWTGFAPFMSGHFPLHPFSNRIAASQFPFDEMMIELTADAPGEKYPLHGFGWVNPWEVLEAEPDKCRLVQTINTPAWPWVYTATHNISVAQNILRLELEVTNQSESRMPCGLGFHPYFSDLDEAEISFESRGVWLCDDDRLPTEWIPAKANYDFSYARQLFETNFDHCFTHVKGAKIGWNNSAKTVRIVSSHNLNRAVLFTDHNNNSFCFEPVSHTHNALNMADPVSEGIAILEPGDSVSCWSEFIVDVQ